MKKDRKEVFTMIFSLFGLFGPKYDDGKIEVTAQNVIGDQMTNPVMEKHLKNVEFNCENGVLTLEGEVKSEKVKKRIYEMVEEKLKKTRIDYDEVIDKMEVAE